MNNEKDTSTIIIKIIAIIMVVGALAGVVAMMVMGQLKPHEDFGVEYAGKYVLTQISGQNDKNGNPITAESYEYNYLNLGEDGWFEIANKINGKETVQKGVWYVKGSTLYLEISKMFGLMKYTDKATIQNDNVVFTVEGKDTNVVMVLTRTK